MQFTYRFEPRDMQALVEATGLRRRFGQPKPWLWYGLGGLNVALGLSRIVLAEGDLTAGWYHWYLAALAFGTPSLYGAWMRRAVQRHPSYGHDIQATFEEHEIVATYGDVVERTPYVAIRKIDERPEHILLWTGWRRAIILPKRAFGSSLDAVTRIRDRIEKDGA